MEHPPFAAGVELARIAGASSCENSGSIFEALDLG